MGSSILACWIFTTALCLLTFSGWAECSWEDDLQGEIIEDQTEDYVSLICRFNLNKDNFYSVIWCKGDEEILAQFSKNENYIQDNKWKKYVVDSELLFGDEWSEHRLTMNKSACLTDTYQCILRRQDEQALRIQRRLELCSSPDIRIVSTNDSEPPVDGIYDADELYLLKLTAVHRSERECDDFRLRTTEGVNVAGPYKTSSRHESEACRYLVTCDYVIQFGRPAAENYTYQMTVVDGMLELVYNIPVSGGSVEDDECRCESNADITLMVIILIVTIITFITIIITSARVWCRNDEKRPGEDLSESQLLQDLSPTSEE